MSLLTKPFQVEVYPDESPALGTGLNKPARITLYHKFPASKTESQVFLCFHLSVFDVYIVSDTDAHVNPGVGS